MRRVDFGIRKTEAGWARSFDEFWLKFTPAFFRFLEWIVVMAVFQFLADYTKYWVVILISVMSQIFLFLFVQSFLFNIEYEGVPLINTLKRKRLFTIILAVVVSSLTVYLVRLTVKQISGYI